MAQGNYFDTVKNEGFLNGQKFVDHNEWRKAGGVDQGSQPTGSVLNSSTNFSDVIKQAVDANRQAVQPAVDTYQSFIPQTQEKFAGEKSRLESRRQTLTDKYDSLLNDIRGSGGEQVNAQTRVTNQEMAKRGILPSSTEAQQNLQNALQPIQRQTNQLLKDSTIASQEAQLNLDDLIGQTTGNEVSALQAIQSAIAGLQAGAGQSGVSQGLNLGQYFDSQSTAQKQFEQQQALQQQQLQQQADQFNKNLALQQAQYQNIELPKAQQALSSSSNNGFADLLKVLGASTSAQQPQLQGKYVPQIGKSIIGKDSQGRNIYSDGTRGWTQY